MGADSYSFHKHPRFDNNKSKIRAREALINFYFELFGKLSIPEDGQYWTLCSNQSKLPGSEIEQLSRAGFIRKDQFYGVDICPKKIAKNKIKHPSAHWFDGDWVSVVQSSLEFYQPSVVYLDSCSVVEGYPIIELINATLEYTPSGVVFLNMMKNNPHSGQVFSIGEFIRTLTRIMNPIIRCSWNLQEKEYTYSSSDKTTMTTLIFTRKI